MVRRSAQIVSYVFGSLSLVLLVVSAFLIGFVRVTNEVITVISPTVTPYVPPSPLPVLFLQPVIVGNLSNLYSPSLVDKIVSPTVSTGNDPTATATAPNPSFTQLPFGPGEIPFNQTIQQPLIQPSQGMGFCVMTSDTNQWFSSFENGFSLWAQFVSQTDPSTGSISYVVNKTSYASSAVDPSQTPANFIYFNCSPGSQSVPELNTLASAVGAVGNNSIALSADNYRLYIAFRQPYTGTNSDSLGFPFQQIVGRINVFSLPETQGLPQSSQSWTYECSLGLQNPFGSQVSMFTGFCDPITHQTLKGDEFGSIIRTTIDRNSNQRVIAARCNFGFIQQNGACIAIYEENSTKQHILYGVIQLWDSYATKSFTLNEKLTFGRDFNISNNVLLAGIRVPAIDCIGNPQVPVYRIAYFRRNDTLTTWEFKQFIESPDTTEDFGVSILISPDATFAIVGSPTLPTGNSPGINGSVYVYGLNSNGQFTQTLRLRDPMITNTQGCFGYFLSSDPLFVVLTISANQNNVLTTVPPLIGTTTDQNKPKVVIVSIDQTNRTLDSSQFQFITQPGDPTVGTVYIDPLFGCNMAIAFENAQYGQKLYFLSNSPINQLVRIDNMISGR